MNPTPNSPGEIFSRLLDESSALLADPQPAGIAFPDDDMHREILLPLLPVMLGDGAIRNHWREQTATGFLARLARHLEAGEPVPCWQAADFEFHVTASYSAGPDARALADTLLSEESLREMSAGLMNQILEAVWPGFATPAVAVSADPVEARLEIPVEEVPEPIEPAVVPRWVALPAVIAVRRAVRAGRPNPIRGTRHSHGGLGAPGWRWRHPIAGCAARMAGGADL